MDNYKLIELLQKEILDNGCDAKAEPQLALAMEKGLNFEDLLISCDSLFFREYNKDVMITEIKEDARKLPVLQFHLTRSGVYDHLPEGLFFQPAQNTPRVTNAAEMAVNHRLNNQKELEIRRFFLPFENDFFLQRMQLESEETKLLEGVRSGILNDYFINFWGLPNSIPKSFIVPLILLIPYANKIAGDLSHTAQCLQQLLHEEVAIQKIMTPLSDATSFCKMPLGEQQLGIDMVCGEQFEEDFPVLECTLGPLQNSQVHDYLEGGKRFTLLQTIYRFFIPVGVDVQTKIEIIPGQKNMELKTENEPVLGYSSFL